MLRGGEAKGVPTDGGGANAASIPWDTESYTGCEAFTGQ
jgi:hypothetical protein